MNTEATYNETSSRDDPRAAMAPGDGEGARGSSRRHPPIRTSLVRALTAPWRLLAGVDDVVVHKTNQECWNIDDSEWLGAERVDDLCDLVTAFEMDVHAPSHGMRMDRNRLVRTAQHAGGAALLLVSLSTAPGLAQSTVRIPDPPSCAACQISATSVARIGTISDPFAIHALTRSVVLTGNGKVYFAPLYEPGRIGVYELATGRAGTAGRPGEGPQELPNAVTGVAVGNSDTIFVFASRRIAKFSPSGQVTSSAATEFSPSLGNTVLALPEGRLVVNSNLPAAQAIGQPLHFFDTNGRLITSFGADAFAPKPQFQSAAEAFRYTWMSFERKLTHAPNGHFWAAHALRYELDLWNPEGVLVRRVVRETDLFVPRTSGFLGSPWEVLPRPRVAHLWHDAANRLWVAIWVAAADWKPAEQGEGGRSNPSRNYDTVIEVIDLSSLKLLARTELRTAVAAFIADDLVVTHNEDADGLLYLEVLRLRIAGGAKP